MSTTIRCVAEARIERVDGMCHHWGLDLTVGCEHRCVYCPFHSYRALELHYEHFGQALAKSLSIEKILQQDEYPSPLYLSPFSDPLAPAAQDNLQRVLKRVLPLGVRVGISTKALVPHRVFRILSQWPDQVVLFVGLSSLDDDRNRSVEPGCPPARARLENLRRARQYGLTQLSVRLDPLLPDVDDAPEKLQPLLDAVAAAPAKQVAAAYLFLTPLCHRPRLQQVPYLGRASFACTELCPASEASVWSVPLERKQRTYEWLHRECRQRGLIFATCGCKDLRLRGSSDATCCSYPF